MVVVPHQSSAYKLLVPFQSLHKFQNIPETFRKNFKRILLDLAEGTWETWDSNTKVANTNVEFMSFKESNGDQELFTLYIPEIKCCLLWKRVWSVDLLSRIEYPIGTYYSENIQPKIYSPHLVIYCRDTNKPPAFKTAHDGIAYEQRVGINQRNNFYDIKPCDQLTYSEELYLLGRSIIDDLLKGIQRGLPLQMSDEQVKALQNPGPIFVSGEAGSGKTIIVTHWLMINHLRHTQTNAYQSSKSPKSPISQLFVTFSSRLRDNAKNDFLTMLPQSYPDHDTNFRTYRQLIKHIAGEAGILHQFPKENEMTFEKYMKKYAKLHVNRNDIDPVLLWDEMRSVIKGRSSLAQTFIDFPTYQKLSDEREQCKTPERYRKAYYDSAQRYQNYLLEHGYWDELDLVKACIPKLDMSKKYDKIACDEVQDLAPIEIIFLSELIKNADISNLFLTGDTAQVINPSGFQWSQVKGYFGEKYTSITIPEVIYLQKNYRSCEEIVELVNAVLSVRKDLLDDQVSKLKQRPLVKRQVLPMILSGKTTDLLKTLDTINSNPDERLILVKNDEEKEKIIDKLGEARDNNTILTIEEAKGLEYDGALLWNFFIPRHPEVTQNEWERVFVPERRESLKEEIQQGLNPYGLTYEFNLLHVGLTRARYLLYFFDEIENQRMILPLLGKEVEDKLTRGDLKVFQTHWKTEIPSGDTWLRAGERLLDRDTNQAKRFFKLAANAYAQKEEFSNAAEAQEQAGDYDASAEYYKTANDKANELRVLGIKYNISGEHEKAGEIYSELGQLQYETGDRINASKSYEKAMEQYLKAKKGELASDAAYKSAIVLPEDRHLERASKFNRAAVYYSKPKSAINACKKAITEADEAKSSGEKRLDSKPIDAWIAKRHYEIAQSEEKYKNYVEGASSAAKSANLLAAFIDSEDFNILPDKDKRDYRREQIDSLHLSIRLYIKSNQMIKSKDAQKQLLRIVTPEVDIMKIQGIWKEIADLYFESKEMDYYSMTLLQLTEVLKNRGQIVTALTAIKNGFEKIKALKTIPKKPFTDILEKLIDIAKSSNEWGDVSFAHKIYAEECERDFQYPEAWSHYREAGKAYINAESIKAGECFDHGIQLLAKSVGPIEVGKNCLFEIVLQGYATNPGFYDEAEKWLDKSADFFVHDFDFAIKLLTSYLNKEVVEEINRLANKETETTDKELQDELNKLWERRAWLEACIGLVYKKYAVISQTDENKNSSKEWFDKALASAKKTGESKIINSIQNICKAA